MKFNEIYTKEILEPIAQESLSVRAVCHKLGLSGEGNMNRFMARCLKDLDIDISHFLGRGVNKNVHNRNTRAKAPSTVLVLRTSGFRHTGRILRRCLQLIGREYVCVECRNIGTWNSKKLQLEVDHKNNNNLDDRPENLQFLCPNCHSQKAQVVQSADTTDSKPVR